MFYQKFTARCINQIVPQIIIKNQYHAINGDNGYIKC